MKTENMKKGLRLLFAAALVTVVGACTGDFEKYNHNPNETTDGELERDNYNVGAKLLQLQSLVIPGEEHLYQFAEPLSGGAFGGYLMSNPTWTGIFANFNPSADWMKAPFVDVMTGTYAPYRGIRQVTDDPVPLAWADLLRVAIMHRLTDQYGPIPYSKVIEDKKNSLTVSYDTQQEVYTRMFEELDAAIAVLEENKDLSTAAFGEYDLVYGGDLKKWIKYANSLKLRLAMRLTEVDPTTAKTKAAEAIAAGVIETNADNAAYHPAINRLALCYSDWKDYNVSADMVSYLGGYNDPRRGKMFTLSEVEVINTETWEPEKVDTLAGMRIGITPVDKSAAVKVLSRPIVADTDPILWLNAAEVAFLKAEWQLRWGTMSEAGALYKRGVELSFEQWGAGSADAYLSNVDAVPKDWINKWNCDALMAVVMQISDASLADFTAQSSITPVWSDEDDPETALERIITQKWIALFPLCTEAWSEYRRTGYPWLAPVPDECDKSGGTVNPKYGARRLTYPVEEYSENRANVAAAVAGELQGSDTFGARVWWDKKPLN